MVINTTYKDYEIITDDPNTDFLIRHLPTGNDIEVVDGSVNADVDYQVSDTTVVTSQQSAVGKLTDNTGGSTDGTLAAVSGSGADTAINNNLAELNAKIDALVDVLGATNGHGLTAD